MRQAASNISGKIGVIAGKGKYPFIFAEEARKQGDIELVINAFLGETDTRLRQYVSLPEDWQEIRVGQLGKMIKFFRQRSVKKALMLGQITPSNLFALRPDLRALKMLAGLSRRNAESIFGAIADEMSKDGIELLPATTFLEDYLAPAGHIAGIKMRPRTLSYLDWAFDIAKKISAMDIGQMIVVKNGTILAVEDFEGTNATLRRAGRLAGKKSKSRDLLAVKVAKPEQDMRFDAPVIGTRTIEVAREVGIGNIVVEAGMTLMLEPEKIRRLCQQSKICLHGYEFEAKS